MKASGKQHPVSYQGREVSAGEDLELRNSDSVTIKSGLRPQHICASVLEKASWENDHTYQKPLSALANSFLIRD